jgi:hypothetical protein
MNGNGESVVAHVPEHVSLVVALPNLLNWRYRFKMLFGIFALILVATNNDGEGRLK